MGLDRTRADENGPYRPSQGRGLTGASADRQPPRPAAPISSIRHNLGGRLRAPTPRVPKSPLRGGSTMATTMCEIDGRSARRRNRADQAERRGADDRRLRRAPAGAPGSEPRGRRGRPSVAEQPLRRVLLRLLRRQRLRRPHARRRRWHDHHAAAPPGRADRRHAVLQRRHPPTAPACRAEGDGVGEPGRRLDPPALGRDPGRGRSARAAAGRRRPRRDRGADRGGSRRPGAHGRGAVAVTGREGRAAGRLRGVAPDRRVVRGARARAARAGAGHRDRGGRAARAVRDHAHEAARRGHPRRRERRGGRPAGEHDEDARRVRPRPHRGGPPGEARSR